MQRNAKRPTEKRPTEKRPTAKERRQEILDILSAVQLAPHRFPRLTGAEDGATAASRLAKALTQAGPVFWGFGRYFATRFDLLDEEPRERLAQLPAHRPPAPLSRVKSLADEELGPLSNIFADLESVAATSTLYHQEHRGRLLSGEPAILRIVHPASAAELSDLDHLELFAPAFARLGVSPRQFAAVSEDHVEQVRQLTDLAREAALLDGIEAAGSAAPRAPRVERRWRSSRALVREALVGHPSSAPALGARDADLAVRLCQSWLYAALGGQTFPVSLEGESVLVLENGEVAWTGWEWHHLPKASRDNLWEYLLATAVHDPDRACAALLKEIPHPTGPVQTAQLQRRLRQLVPFRDGDRGAPDDLAEYLFLHWRILSEENCAPGWGLSTFYRGLVNLTAIARPLGRPRDVVREGLESAHTMIGLGALGHLASGEQMRDVMAAAAAAMVQMPQKLDEFMQLAAGERPGLKVRLSRPAGDEARKNATTTVVASLVAMITLVLLDQRIEAAWWEPVAAVLFLTLGALLLKGLGSTL